MRLFPSPIRLNPRTRLPYTDPRNRPGLWTPRKLYVWQKASFTVPADVSEERVQEAASKYRNKFGKSLETEGFTVLGMDGPHRDRSVVGIGVTDPDRKRYVLWAKVRRRPVEVRVDVSDEDVALYQKAGFRLT